MAASTVRERRGRGRRYGRHKRRCVYTSCRFLHVASFGQKADEKKKGRLDIPLEELVLQPESVRDLGVHRAKQAKQLLKGEMPLSECT